MSVRVRPGITDPAQIRVRISVRVRPGVTDPAQGGGLRLTVGAQMGESVEFV